MPVTETQDAAGSAVRVHVGGDHAAYELKNYLVDRLKQDGYEVMDHGPLSYDAQDDYPPFVLRAAEAVISEPGSVGVVLGGSGNGEQIAANKVSGVRAALAWNDDVAKLARQHNDANVIAIGARQHTMEEAARLLHVFLEARYLGEPRHQRRVEMLTQYETTRALPPLPHASNPEAASG
jgi:ribose 5-phosphate isomerase B